jgi:hypothetical protein
MREKDCREISGGFKPKYVCSRQRPAQFVRMVDSMFVGVFNQLKSKNIFFSKKRR